MKNKKIIFGIIAIGIAFVIFLNMCSSGIKYSDTDRGFRIKAKCSYSAGECVVKGSIKNNNSISYHTVQLRALIYDKAGNLIGSEGFFINDINAGESSDFQEFIEVNEKPSKMTVEIFGLL